MTENIANNNTNNDSGIAPYLLPNFCDVRILFIVVLLTEVLAIIFAMASSSSSEQFWDYLALSSLLMLWIALLNAAVLCWLRGWLHRQKQSHCLVISFSLMMFISLLVTILASLANTLLYFEYGNYHFDALFFIRVITISAAIYFLLLRYFYIQQQWRLNLAAQSKAEIQALRARIRPHFLFNSMNSIAALTGSDPARAELAVQDLSDMFRVTLRDAAERILLEEEIDVAKRYLRMESLRLGDRLQVEWDIERLPRKRLVPSLILQPLLENAVYHGIEALPQGGHITIHGTTEGKRIVITIRNPRATRNIASHRKGNRIALENIRLRLQLAFGNQAGVAMREMDDAFETTLYVPREKVS